MYASKPGLMIGFHGCDKTIQHKVVNNLDNLKNSTNRYDWLGNGIYFWENNSQRAFEFATGIHTNRGKKRDISIPAVIGAVIDMGFCLDLLDSEYLLLVKDSYEVLKWSWDFIGAKMPENKNVNGSNDLLLRFLDCEVIENLHLLRRKNNLREFDSVRSLFVEGEELYKGAGFNNKNHIQICIRNPNCIKGYFIPRIADKNFSIP